MTNVNFRGGTMIGSMEVTKYVVEFDMCELMDEQEGRIILE